MKPTSTTVSGGGGERSAERLGIVYRPVYHADGTFAAVVTRAPKPGSPAARLGLENGDTILALDGQPFREPADVLNHRAETTVKLVDVRSRQTRTLSVFIP